MIGFGRPGAHFDMIHTHMTWNEHFVKNHMPNDTYKFSIIRHPVSHLTSSWKYFFQSGHHVRPRIFFNVCNLSSSLACKNLKILKVWRWRNSQNISITQKRFIRRCEMSLICKGIDIIFEVSCSGSFFDRRKWMVLWNLA